MKTVLFFKNVTKKFNSSEIINNLSFNVKEKDVLGIIGPSGSGKTTILKLIAGILNPDEGEISLSSDRIGFVFQDGRLLPWKTALENVSIPLSGLNKNRDEVIKESKKWLDKLGLGNSMDYYPSQLSGGMLQRVSLARAFAVRPEILILDEPFTGLDDNLKNDLYETLLKLLESYPVTMIYVSHDIGEVRRIATRLLIYEHAGHFRELEEPGLSEWKNKDL